MRGEYKVPGGKLVAVDVEVADGRLTGAAVSGDFFLEPDTALEDIDAALVGQPADAGVADLTRVVSASLADDVAMVGFSAEAVAIAVRRALGHATRWEDHTFEIVHEGPQSPAMHMALDQSMAEAVGAGTRRPTLRIWEWGAPAVVIGSFQSLSNEVDPEGAQRHGITVVRRISGGGAMFIEPGNTITYSLTVPASLVEGLSFERSYAFLDDWVIGALGDLGIEARYVPLNDIASPAGKIAGAAQKRLASGAVLHHVTMAYDIDAMKMLEVLRIGREKISDKGTTSANKRVDPLRSQTGMARADVITSFKASFRARYRTVDGEVTAAERARAEDLVRTRFDTPEWTARVP
ncbi:biotin/lipoate A/B protein ligase family protein [Isoptericola sp. b490]|uniref:lipoate--protein ligase family protein n=1 Tax=Actinotalea lenta TaxID=3064654 RepID=UPI0027129B36|nr:biotin/lipoate A/B protein ligase family protein [Isoptericola sp. b490]MDO8120120.1 biotin/lipoate A/B protein ligase family protein [Isoptericola sp. b490]